MAIGSKIGGAKKGRIRQGMKTDEGKFDERPLRDENAESGGGGGNDNRRYLDVASGTASDSPPQQQQHDADDPPADSDEARRALGPVEKRTSKKTRGENGVSNDGPMPLKMERMLAPPRNAAIQTPQQQAPSQAQSANVMTSDVNIINHCDVALRLIAVDTAGSGRKVERKLLAKSGDQFVAPMGCTISIVHPVTQKAVFRFKVTDVSTTLAVTDAALSAALGGSDDGTVGSSGRWYDNRGFVAIAGAGVVCGVLLVAALVALLVRYLMKQQKLRLKGAAAGWQAAK